VQNSVKKIKTGMIETKKIVEEIIKGMQERKAKKIVVVDMTNLEERACDYFVICEGSSNTQVMAIADEMEDYVRKSVREKPFAIAGRENAEWIAVDYGDIMAHVFLPESREFYDIEHLWEDAHLIEVPDLD
jgi:ribosome-associated protein